MAGEQPLYQALLRAAARRRLHMPGHFGRSPAGGDFLTWAADLTETEGLDNLGQPEGVLRGLAERMARLYGAGQAWLSVQGATLAVMAGTLGWVGRQKRVAIDRGAHKSVLAAAVLGEWHVSWVDRPIDPAWGLSVPPPPASWPVSEGLACGILVSPTYEGIQGRLPPLPVFVDAAHGAHFGRHPTLPPHPLTLGAELVAHGLHKTEPVLTQTGILLARSPQPAVDGWWRLLSTSSPSYLLLASIEAYAAARERGDGGWGRFAEEMRQLWQWAAAEGYRIWQADREQAGDLVDVAKLTVWGDGPAMVSRLRSAGYEPEAWGLNYVTLVFGPAQGWSLTERQRAVAALGPPSAAPGYAMVPPRPGAAAMTPAEAWRQSRRRVTFRESRGRIAAAALTPYPPGIPVVMPGEVLEPEMLAYLEELRRRGGIVEGWEGGDEPARLWIVDA
jgi:arginine/lysine/ornithine decarboxylase